MTFCEAESQPDLSTLFTYTVSGVSRKKYFTITATGTASWTASASALPVADQSDNQQVGTVNGVSVTASTVVNQRPLADWDPIGATATLNRNMALCALGCFDAIAGYSTPAYVSRDVPRSATLMYRSGLARPMGVVELETLASGTPAPLYYELRLKRPDGSYETLTNGQTVLYVARSAGRQRLTMQFDASALPTGMYAYTAVVKGVWSDATREKQYAVPVLVNNAYDSEFGWGWRLAGEQRITSQSGGLVVTDGDGSIAYFAGSSGGATGYAYTTPAGDFSVIRTVAQPQSDGAYWERSYPDSTKVRFRSDGRMISAADRFGAKTTFNRLNGLQIYQITDPHGQSLTFAYSGSKVTSITDPMGRVSYIDIDASGNVAQIRDPESSASIAFTATFDAFHRMVNRTNRAGSQWTFDYDHASTLAAGWTPAVIVNGGSAVERIAVRTRSTWAAAIPNHTTGSGTSSSNPGPAICPDSAPATVTDGEGNVTKYLVDWWGQPLTILDAVGRTTQITRNGIFATSITHPTGGVDQFRYVGPNLVWEKPYGKDSISYRYGSGYAIADSVWGPNRPGQRIFVNTNPSNSRRVDSIRVAGSKVTRYHSSALPWFRLDSIVDNGAKNGSGTFVKHVTKYHYDATWGNVDSVLTPAGRWTRGTFDAYGRTASVRSLGANTQWTQYDILNRPTKQWTEGWSPTDTVFTFYGRVTIDSTRDGKGQVYRDSVNALGWVVKSYHPDASKPARYVGYDRNGRPVSRTDRRGKVLQIAYDGVGRTTRRWDSDGLISDTLWYENSGLRVIGSNGASRDTITFNAMGELQSSVKVFNAASSPRYGIAYSYDSRGRRTNHVVASPANGVVFVKPVRTYGLDGMLNQIQMQYGTTSVNSSFYYNEEFQLDTTVLGDGGIRAVTYTTNHEVVSVAFNQANRNQAFKRSYGRDSLGRISSLLSPSYATSGNDQLRVAYDGKGQLVGTAPVANASSCSSPSWDYGQSLCGSLSAGSQVNYDAVANITSWGSVTGLTPFYYDPGNLLRQVSTEMFTYDADGNLTARSGTSRTYTWDAAGRLRCSTANGVETCYDYNAFGELVRRRSQGANDRWYLWSDDQLLAELDSTATQRVAEYVYRPGVDAPFALVTGATQVAVVRYFEQDEVGNVIGVHGQGDVVHQRIEYNPWGAENITHGTLADTSRLRWKGLMWEAPVELYYMRNRWYDPQIGRFMSEDPIGLAGGMNKYAFGGGDPINSFDPSGLDSKPDGSSSRQNDENTYKTVADNGGLHCETRNASGGTVGSRDGSCTSNAEAMAAEISAAWAQAEAAAARRGGAGMPRYLLREKYYNADYVLFLDIYLKKTRDYGPNIAEYQVLGNPVSANGRWRWENGTVQIGYVRLEYRIGPFRAYQDTYFKVDPISEGGRFVPVQPPMPSQSPP